MGKKAHSVYEDCAVAYYVVRVAAQQVGCAKLEVCCLHISNCIKGTTPKNVLQCRLYSRHLQAMYGHNFAFFDPQIWFNEEVLRKQVGQLNGCMILVG